MCGAPATSAQSPEELRICRVACEDGFRDSPKVAGLVRKDPGLKRAVCLCVAHSHRLVERLLCGARSSGPRLKAVARKSSVEDVCVFSAQCWLQPSGLESMKAAAGAGAGVALDLPEGHKQVPNFNLPSALSGKLWKSMRMTPKKLECEKEFYEKILRAPCQARIVWKCVSTCDSVRQGAKPVKTKATKLKLPKVSSPSSSPPTQGSTSSSASMSLKAKLLAAAPSPCDPAERVPETNTDTPSSLDSPCQSVPPSTPESPVKSSPKVQPNRKDDVSDDLEWGGGGRRGESGNGIRRRRKAGVGKRKRCGGRNEASNSPENDSKCDQPQPVRLKLRRLPTSTSMSPPLRQSDKVCVEHGGLGRRDSLRQITSEPESPDSAMEMSDQALALKLHYAMNPRPSRRSQRVSKAIMGSSMTSSKTEEHEGKLFGSPESSF